MLPTIIGTNIGDPEYNSAIAAWCSWMRNDQDIITGPQNHITLIALGCAESSLDNLAIGENWRNGTDHNIIGEGEAGPIDVYYSMGLGFIQHDTGWLELDRYRNGVTWAPELIRADPAYSLDLLRRRPGFLLYDDHGTQILDISYWRAWAKAKRYVKSVGDIYHGSSI